MRIGARPLLYPEGVREPLSGVYVIENSRFRDDRGVFGRLFDAGWDLDPLRGMAVSQVNHSVTHRRGTVRGLHYQTTPYCETKIVTCTGGRIFDVVVDLRRGSPGLLSWHSEILSGDDPCTIVIPPGFAHGFQTLSDECELVYVHSQPFRPEFEDGLHPSDPRIGIRWPEPIGMLSDRDAARPCVAADWMGIDL